MENKPEEKNKDIGSHLLFFRCLRGDRKIRQEIPGV